MYDDFKSGFNYGIDKQRPVKDTLPVQGKQIRQVKFEYPRTYDTSKFTRMRGPNGEQGEIYASGKMYIITQAGKTKVRTFPSRQYGQRYMQKLGWEIV